MKKPLFFLRARGIDSELAEGILIYGFAKEMILRLPLLQAEEFIARKLAGYFRGGDVL